MARFTRTSRAEEDLIKIWTYVAAEDLAAADRLLDGIDELCGRLAENPRMGPARPDLATGLRYFVIGAYLVLYRATSGGVEVVRVAHGARDLPNLFGEG